MTDAAPSAPSPATPDSAAGAAAHTVPSEAPPAWKPEPRQWSWKDLFTAPMLAFKPKCMVVSAVTLLLIGLWWMALSTPLFGASQSLEGQLRYNFDTKAWYYLVLWIWVAASAGVFSLGATFVSVFFKADLLDDEFLSFKEAWQQFAPRIVPALLVPLFLLVLATGVWAAIYLGSLVCSIPYAGPTLYAVLWPLAFAGAVLAVLIVVAVALSGFLFPGIIAVRRHGWFDNVVDTIEAVGTKPHLLVAAIVLTWLMAFVAYQVGTTAVNGLSAVAQHLPGAENQVKRVEMIAATKRDAWLAPLNSAQDLLRDSNRYRGPDFIKDDFLENYRQDGEGKFITYGPGYITAAWQTVIIALLVGYCLNVALAGGMLAYLWVREDDYWDDEDLQDLDQLAKELEAEAAKESTSGKTQATAS